MFYDTQETVKTNNKNESELVFDFLLKAQMILKELNFISYNEKSNNQLIYNVLLNSWNTPFSMILECDKIDSFYSHLLKGNINKLEEVDSIISKIKKDNKKCNLQNNCNIIDDCSTKKSSEDNDIYNKVETIEIEEIPEIVVGNYKLKARLRKLFELKFSNFKRRIVVPIEKKFSGRSKIAKKKVRVHGRFVKQTKKVFKIKV